MTLRRRLERLERQAGMDVDETDVWLIRLVPPGATYPAWGFRYGDTVIVRAEGETDEALEQRCREASSGPGVTCWLGALPEPMPSSRAAPSPMPAMEPATRATDPPRTEPPRPMPTPSPGAIPEPPDYGDPEPSPWREAW